MSKVLINLKKGTDITKAKQNDVLIYDNTDKSFYLVSSDVFFQKYEKKLNELLKRYDERDQEMTQEIEDLKNDFVSFTISIKESNSKLIEMVESFIKENDK